MPPSAAVSLDFRRRMSLSLRSIPTVTATTLAIITIAAWTLLIETPSSARADAARVVSFAELVNAERAEAASETLKSAG